MTAMTFAFIFAASFAAKAQYGMVAGGSCPYQQDMGDDVTSAQDDIKQANDELKELKIDLKDAKTDVKDFQRNYDRAKQDFERRGLQDDFAGTVESHIENGAKCTDYKDYVPVGGMQVAPQPNQSSDQNSARRGVAVDSHLQGSPNMGQAADIAGPGASNDSEETNLITSNRAPANAPSEGNNSTATATGGGNQDHGQFTTDEWHSVCDPYKAGHVTDSVCQIDRMKVEKVFSLPACKKSVKDMYDAQQKLKAAQNKQDNLQAAIDSKKEDIASLKRNLRDAIKQHNEDLKEEMTEGGCVDCMLKSSGYQVERRDNSSSTGAVVTNLGLGIASMVLGNQMQKTVAGYNARLGYPTQPVPAFGYGYPFIMAGVGAAIAGGAGGGGYYGAVGSGGGNGAFGCASTGGGGMNGGGGMMYGPGGVMGYPNGMYGNPMAGGGMYMPGQGSWGGNGFNGMNGMFPGGLMGGGGYMAGYPMGGMAGVSFMTGGGGGMMGYPMGGGMAMGGYPMGGMMPGMMAGASIMAGGGGMMGYPMGGGMAMGGMMGMDPAMMQMQMQMQQQQMQLQMQMQQRAQENYMSRYQTVMGLQTELQGLMSRLQQAQMSLQYGGYTDISLGVGTGTTYYGGSTLGQPIYSTPTQPVYSTPGTIGIPGTSGTGGASVR